MRIVVPHALQMGWQESPAYFCTATKTDRDVIHWLIQSDLPMPKHPMEQHILPERMAQPSNSTVARPWQVSVYVDDYIMAVLSTVGIRFVKPMARATLYGIHSIFPPPIITGHTGGKYPISLKKLENFDAKLMTPIQIALPVAIFENIMANEGVSRLPNVQATADLTMIAFYFLLRVGKYTQPTSRRPTRTTQFRLKDATFWRHQTDGTHVRLPFDAPDEALLLAKAVTLTLDNQKTQSATAPCTMMRCPAL
jgi:hypothetical protein